MGRIIGIIVGIVLIAAGVVALFGAVELAQGDEATTEAIAQGFLVPVSLFIIGVFALVMAWRGRRPDDG